MKKLNITNIKGWLILILILTSHSVVFSQQDPMYTQYNFNTQVINPAYAGTWESLGFMVLGRHQWVGFDDAPRTYTFSMQAPVNDKVALGLNMVSDRIGFEKRLMVNADYSYKIQMSDKWDMRLGIKGGITNYTTDFSTYVGYPGDTSDPLFHGDIDAKWVANFGVGMFLFSEKTYLGITVPKIIENTYTSDYTNYSNYAELRHFFIQAGHVFTLSENLKFKPTTLLKVTTGAPVELDLTGNFIFGNKISLGAMYRTNDSYGFLASWIFNERLRLGYSIDFNTNNLQHYNNGTHELMVSYEIGYRKKWTTPRMF